VLSKAVEVLALLLELGLELKKLLLLALADGVVLVGLLAALPGVTATQGNLGQQRRPLAMVLEFLEDP
jgi:hypothetical protein